MSSKDISNVLELDEIKMENAEEEIKESTYSQHFDVSDSSIASFKRAPFYMLFLSKKKV